VLELDPNYHLFLVRKCDNIVVFALLYAFNELSTAFLDFMAAVEAYRDRGMGSMLFKYTLNAAKWLVTNSIGVILEVEREKITEPDKNGFRRRRVKFYRRHGAKVLHNVNYMLPDLHGDKSQEMYLMIIPNQVLAFIEKSFVYRMIKGIYLTVYDHNDKSGLLDLTLDGLPLQLG
jgi:hypothetical protein